MRPKPLKVRELIARLQQLDPSTIVVRRSYESGLDSVSKVEEIIVTAVSNPKSWSGQYERVPSDMTLFSAFPAIYLN